LSSYPQSPRELVQSRFAWLAAGDFSSIYRSYHPDARLRGHFPSEESYIEFAREQQLDQFELLQLEVIDQMERGNLARILTAQVFRLKGEKFRYLDVTTLRFDGLCWRILSGKRREAETAEESEQVSLEAVYHDPQSFEY